MKRLISLILVVMIILLTLPGCVDKHQTNLGASQPRLIEKLPYITVTNTYADEEISIRYPQVRGLGDNSKEKEINELIKNDILGATVNNLNIDRSAGEMIDLTLDFKVEMDSPEILSILYTGRSTCYRGQPQLDIRRSYLHENWVHTITIDLEAVKKLKLSDFTNIDAELVKKVKESKRITNNAVEGLYLNFGESDDKERYRQELAKIVQDKSDEYLLRELENNDNGFCVTSDSLTVAIGTYNAAGHFALVEIPR